tara:strand:- start:1434 stop:1955 length:522 start_codon:yes stop_codon:yes gene_type:complete
MDLIKRNELKLNDLTDQINTLKTKSNHGKYVPFEDLSSDFTSRTKLHFNPMVEWGLYYTVLEISKMNILAEKLKISELDLINRYFRIGKKQNLFRKDLLLYKIFDTPSQNTIQSMISGYSYTIKAFKQIAIPNYYTKMNICFVNKELGIRVKAKIFTTIDVKTLTTRTKGQFI